MARRLDWEKARQRDRLAAPPRTEGGVLPNARQRRAIRRHAVIRNAERAPTARQLSFIAVLCQRAGTDPPHVTTREGASATIALLKAKLAARQPAG